MIIASLVLLTYKSKAKKKLSNFVSTYSIYRG